MSALGVGIGWRPDIAGYVRSLPGLRFTESPSVFPVTCSKAWWAM